MADADTLIAWRFGRFLLEPSRRSLTADGTPVALSSRGFDILVLLVEERGRILGKEEILNTVWRGMAVEENNLAVQMSALRRALSERPGAPQLIVTVPGQGYRFVGAVADAFEPAPAAPQRFSPPSPPRDPAAPGGLLPADEAAPRRGLFRPAMAILVCALAASAWFGLASRHEAAAPRLSIAVMPFRNLSSDRQQDYLADAISDDLTTDLSYIPGSLVIARTSADVYRNRKAGAVEIGRALHVRYLLEGSLQTDGGTYHVNAQLIDAATGSHLWARRFDVTRDRLASAQEQIVSQLASALNFKLVEVEAARSLHDRPDNPDAVDLFLRARSAASHAETLAQVTAAQALFEQAIRKDPASIDSLSELGILLSHKIERFDDPDDDADYRRAREVTAQALAASPNNPAAIISHGMLASLNGQCDEAIPAFQRALALGSSQLRAHLGLVDCALRTGRMEDLVTQAQTVLRLDPTGPRVPAQQELVGMAYLMLGKPAEALTWLNLAGATMEPLAGPQPSLGWREWRQVYLIAATWLNGGQEKARRLYAEYNKNWPLRSVWQLASYGSHALSRLPARAAYTAALRNVGMPAFIDETTDFGVPEAAQPQVRPDMDPTPRRSPVAKTLTTSQLHDLLAVSPKPLVLDYGRGVCVMPGAVWVWSSPFLADERKILDAVGVRTALGDGTPVVVMSGGPLSWDSYNKAIELGRTSGANVYWYRGGEEAWSRSGMQCEDRRSP